MFKTTCGHMYRSEINIKTNLKERGCEDVILNDAGCNVMAGTYSFLNVATLKILFFKSIIF
jgi:hypothetical protein